MTVCAGWNKDAFIVYRNRLNFLHFIEGSWLKKKKKKKNSGCAVARAAASHPRGPVSIPEVNAICGLSLLLVRVPAPRVVLRFSSLHKNKHFQIPIRPGTHGHLCADVTSRAKCRLSLPPKDVFALQSWTVTTPCLVTNCAN